MSVVNKHFRRFWFSLPILPLAFSVAQQPPSHLAYSERAVPAGSYANHRRIKVIGARLFLSFAFALFTLVGLVYVLTAYWPPLDVRLPQTPEIFADRLGSHLVADSAAREGSRSMQSHVVGDRESIQNLHVS